MQVLIDRAEILDLLATMTRLLNDQRVERCLEAYADDGAFELVGQPPLRGRDAIGAMMRALPGVVHMTTDVVATIDGDEAVADSNLFAAWARVDRAENGFLYSGRYHDHLVRTPAGWKLRHRRLSLDLDAGRVFEVVRAAVGEVDCEEWAAAAAARWDDGGIAD